MMKKIVFLVLVLGLFGGGFFYWRQSQADVRELNKNLPDGVKVAKSLFGNEYRVVNKIDGYSFKVPDEWKGVKDIEYTQEWTEKGYAGRGIGIEGIMGTGRIIGIDYYKVNDQSANLEEWVKNFFLAFDLTGKLDKDNIEAVDIIKTQESGDQIYFLKGRDGSKIYAISGSFEESIKEIILNGKW